MAKDVIIALDFENKEKTLAFLDQFTGRKPFVKIGMELFYAEGPDIVREIKARGHKIFLDLKLHDIPNTVKKAMKVLSKLDVDMTNLHAAGTIAMMEAAKEGLTKEDGSCGVLFSVIYNMAAGILNAAGNSQRSLIYLGCASITNIILDLVLIAGLRMGVEGAAIATDISQLVSCILSLRFLMRVEDDYRVTLRKIRPDAKMSARIIRVGLPTGIQNMVISFSNVLVQSSVNGYGAVAMAGFAAYMKIDGFNILPVMSFSMAATTFVGQNFGAGKLDRVKRSLWVTLAMSVGYTLFTGALLLVFRYPILHLFTQDDTVVEFGVAAMKYFCPFYFLLAILHSLAGAVRGTGKSVPPMVVLLLSLCLFRVAWIQFILPFFHSIEGVFVLYPVSWGLGAVLMVLYTWRANWMEHAA